ncbi:MAG TPA: hypothetical protein VF260_00120 [Bacilli bacterium]
MKTNKTLDGSSPEQIFQANENKAKAKAPAQTEKLSDKKLGGPNRPST